MAGGRVKVLPGDFVVTECAELEPGLAGEYACFRIRKQGLSTFEAVQQVANVFAVPEATVSYAGLKDEDGITEQLLTVPKGSVPFTSSSHEPLRAIEKDGVALDIAFVGFTEGPAQIGQLIGNIFRVVVRDVDPESAEALRTTCRHDQLFLNYYDTQRFGVPTGPKTTHMIGSALLAGNHESAFQLLAQSDSKEGQEALAWHGSADSFFERIDSRTIAFYKNSHESHSWNARLANLARSCSSGALERVKDGIAFTFARVPLEVANLQDSLSITNHRSSEGIVVPPKDSHRTTVLQARFRCVAEEDELFPGRARCSFRFFLPSGCYATMALWQLLDRCSIDL